MPNQELVLALHVTRKGFERLLANSYGARRLRLDFNPGMFSKHWKHLKYSIVL